MLEISISMILDTLAEQQPECLCEKEDIFFSGLRLYERGQTNLSPQNIYMCASRELDNTALESGCYFLCINKMSPALRSRCAGKRVVVIENDAITLASAFNTIQRLFTDLREWHQNMHVSLIKNNNVQELLKLSETAIGNPIALVDLGFKLLAHTDGIETDDEVYNDLIHHGYHTARNIDRMTHGRQVESIKNHNTVDVEFPLPQLTRYQTMTKTFYIDSIPYAYLRMICSSEPPSRSLEERFALLAESVEMYLHSNYSVNNISKNIYEYVLVELIERHIVDTAQIEERSKHAGLDMMADYQLAKIVFEDEENISLNYMLEQLRVIFPKPRPFIYKNCIIMLTSRESSDRKEEREHGEFRLRALQDFLSHYHAHCGFSSVFSSLALISDAYVQTGVALELGGRLQDKLSADEHVDQQQRIFSYEDYLVYHLISVCGKDLHLQSLCDERLLQIWERDKQKNTKNVELLRTYLKNNCRPTDTGKILHMHRNNVIYHIERLSEQFDLDLEDPEACLRLLISFKVLELL